MNESEESEVADIIWLLMRQGVENLLADFWTQANIDALMSATFSAAITSCISAIISIISIGHSCQGCTNANCFSASSTIIERLVGGLISLFLQVESFLNLLSLELHCSSVEQRNLLAFNTFEWMFQK